MENVKFHGAEQTAGSEYASTATGSHWTKSHWRLRRWQEKLLSGKRHVFVQRRSSPSLGSCSALVLDRWSLLPADLDIFLELRFPQWDEVGGHTWRGLHKAGYLCQEVQLNQICCSREARSGAAAKWIPPTMHLWRLGFQVGPGLPLVLRAAFSCKSFLFTIFRVRQVQNLYHYKPGSRTG